MGCTNSMRKDKCGSSDDEDRVSYKRETNDTIQSCTIRSELF